MTQKTKRATKGKKAARKVKAKTRHAAPRRHVKAPPPMAETSGPPGDVDVQSS